MKTVVNCLHRFAFGRKSVFITALCCCLALHSIVGHAQIKGNIKLLKAEKIPLPKGYDVYTVYSLGQSGLVMHTTKLSPKVSDYKEFYTVYDTNLVKIANFEETMISGFFTESNPEWFESDADGAYHHMYIEKSGVFALRNVYSSGKSVKISNIRGQFDLGGKKIRRFRKFYAFGSYVYMELTTESADILLLRLNWRNGSAKAIPLNIAGIENKLYSELVEVAPIAGSDDFLAVVRGEMQVPKTIDDRKHRPKKYFLYRVNKEGNIVQVINFDKQYAGNLSFLKMRVHALNLDKYAVSGTYTVGEELKQYGMFVGICDRNGMQVSSFMDFRELKGFYQYTPPGDKKHLGDFKPGKNQRGEKFPIEYEFSPHALVPIQVGYLLQMEMFYKMTHENPGNKIDIITDEGHQYTHLFQLKLDENCQRETYQTLPMQYFTTSNDKYQQVQVKTICDSTIVVNNVKTPMPVAWKLRYKDNFTVVNGTFSDATNTWKLEEVYSINPTGENAELIKSVYESMQYWCGNTYHNNGFTNGKKEAVVLVKLGLSK